MGLNSSVLFVPFLAQAAGAMEDPHVGISAGVAFPLSSVRGALGCKAGGMALGCHLGQGFAGGHGLRLGFTLGMADGGEDPRMGPPGTHLNLHSYRLGLDYLIYPLGVPRGPFLLVGLGALRMRTRTERWLPSNPAECMRKGHVHGMDARPVLTPAFVPGKGGGMSHGALGVQECGEWDMHPIADTGVRLAGSVGCGFTWRRTWEVGVRCDGLQAFGHTLTVVGVTAGVRF